MDKKQNLILTVIAAALLALIALITLVEPEEEPAGPADLVDVRPEEVSRLHLISDAGALTAERSEVGWQIVDPWRAPGDAGELDGLVELLDRLRIDRDFEGADPAQYGLDAPRASLTLTLAAGGERALRVGDASPVGTETYVQLDGGPARLASGQPLDTLGQPLERFRESRLHLLAGSSIDGVRWRGPEHEASLRRTDEGWLFDDGRRARGEAIAGFLAATSTARLEGFLDGDALGAPRAELILSAGEDAATIRLGERREEGWPLETALGTLGWMSSTDELELLVGSLLDDRLVPYSPTELSEVTVTLDGESVTIGVDDERLSALIDARVDRTAALPDLTDRAGAVEILTGARRLEIAIGQATPGGRLGQEGDGPAFLIPDETLEALRGLR